MLCETCQKQPATVHLTEITDGQKREYHLCEECAGQRANITPTIGSNEAQAIHSMVEIRRGESTDTRSCPRCGITFAQFRRQGRLGCPHDYEVFAPEITQLLDRIHGRTRHRGKRPEPPGEEVQHERRRRELASRQAEAVAREDFEEAARLRDQLKQLDLQTGPE